MAGVWQVLGEMRVLSTHDVNKEYNGTRSDKDTWTSSQDDKRAFDEYVAHSLALHWVAWQDRAQIVLLHVLCMTCAVQLGCMLALQSHVCHQYGTHENMSKAPAHPRFDMCTALQRQWRGSITPSRNATRPGTSCCTATGSTSC